VSSVLDSGRERRRRLEMYLDRGLGKFWLRQPAIAKLTESAFYSAAMVLASDANPPFTAKQPMDEKKRTETLNALTSNVFMSLSIKLQPIKLPLSLCFFVAISLFSLTGCISGVATREASPVINNAVVIPQLNVDYDARQFLSQLDVITFNHVFPNFDENTPIKDWEWKDVDPLGLYTAAQNRQARRYLFLFEITPTNLLDDAGSPNPDQIAFKQVVEEESPGIKILLTARTAKILSPFTEKYETNGTTFRIHLLTKTASWGLRWAQVGGKSLYIYNGNVLISRFKYGYVGLPSCDIDRPFLNEVKR